MLPVKVEEQTIRRHLIDFDLNNECLKTELDLMLELRDKAKLRKNACKRRMSRR